MPVRSTLFISMNSPDDHDAKIIDQFSQQAEGYRRLTASLPSDRSAALRTDIRPGTEDLLLEICCGPGLLTLDFAPYVRHATGLDLTPAMLEQARQRLEPAGVLRLRVRHEPGARHGFAPQAVA